MGSRRYALMLSLRVILLALCLSGLLYLLFLGGYPTAAILLLLAVALMSWELLRFVHRTNRELSRFLDALRYADFGQRFEVRDLGAGFDELGQALEQTLLVFQRERALQEQQLRQLQALTEHVPVPLVSLFADGNVRLHNNAARRLFGLEPVSRASDLASFGSGFREALETIAPGERRLVEFCSDEQVQRLMVSATEVISAGGTEKLLSLQNIQSELDAAQLQAWQELVRVLTHEIMNSITPITSLARTAAELMREIADSAAGEELQDVSDAVQTVARRADGLMHFVQGYRRLTRLPAPERQALVLGELFDDVAQLACGDWGAQGLRLETRVQPRGLELEADREQLEQVLLNLLQNAAQALAPRGGGRVRLGARLNRDGRPCIEVEDDGPGVDPEIATKVFVPFFTTRREGSGVGLALTRQVMLAHGGSVTLGRSDLGGARLTLGF